MVKTARLAATARPWLVYADGFIAANAAALPLQRLEQLRAVALAESLPFRAGKPVLLAAHLDRLAEGCRALAWRDPDRSLIAKVCRALPAKNRMKAGSLRLRWWGGLEKPLLLGLAFAPGPLPEHGLRLMTSAVRHYGPDSLNARAKAATMLPNWLSKAETQAWADDGLRLTPDGLVAEAVWSNLVAVKRGVARTPPLHQGVLEGVTRGAFLRRLRAKGLDVREEPLTRYDLWTADQVWVTSSIRGALRVKEVDGRGIGGPGYS
jgi:branched-chain amino acid aminotransferase